MLVILNKFFFIENFNVLGFFIFVDFDDGK